MVDKNVCLECGSDNVLIISLPVLIGKSKIRKVPMRIGNEFRNLLYCKNCSLLKKINLLNQKKKVITLKRAINPFLKTAKIVK